MSYSSVSSPDGLRSIFPGSPASPYSMSSSAKTPLFFIDNLLSSKAAGKEAYSKPPSSGYASSPTSSLGSVNSMWSAVTGGGGLHRGGMPPPDSSQQLDHGQRLLSAAFPQNPFFAGGSIPFPMFSPGAMHPQDVRSFLQGAQGFHVGQYGGISPNSLALVMNGIHPNHFPHPHGHHGHHHGHHGGPHSRPLHKRKGGQVRFSNDQTLDLEQKFKKQKYLNPAERKKLAKSLILSERQIKTWFQNRRAKWRRSKDGGEQTDSGDHDQTLLEACNGGATASSSSSSSTATHPAASSSSSSSEDSRDSSSSRPNKQSRHHPTGRPSSLTGFSGTAVAVATDDRHDHELQEMCNSDSESVCSDDLKDGPV
ncbi:putative Hematopoietically-expressed homeobox protein hhex [Hypsibius exemplaris]|uniref:Hematopoietically-expressed homeobox protein hhex n=1 Tax=Hypsibius exemplaris TaxID=2072580 RepID=A0A1W0XAI4_HYPEX|nr:putative Hematopoietically-expressed homeobox protein hhex [Hypsibius exemplaris]